MPPPEEARMDTATFGAGCFWGVEAAFGKIPGVVSTTVGYAGGTKHNPSYEEVCRGDTGHTEVVRVDFDPDRVGYAKLLSVFWECHDPTQVNRQGPDFGYQYRSVVFGESNAQLAAARASKEELEGSGKYSHPIATAVEPFRGFYRAEEYHQQYLAKRGQAVCHA